MKNYACAALLLVCSGGVASASVIAYDGFAYLPGPLVGNGPGTGFNTFWIGDGGLQVTAVGLSSSLAAPSTGGAVGGFFNYESRLSAPVPNHDFWASFLVQHNAPNDQTYMGLTIFGGSTGVPPLIAFGIRLGHYGIFDSTSAFIPAPLVPFTPGGSTDFLLTHFHPTGASWTVSLYVNPVNLASGPDLIVPGVPPVLYDAVLNQNQAGFFSDEVRLGDTPQDAGFAGVPAPGAGVLALVCIAALARRRR